MKKTILILSAMLLSSCAQENTAEITETVMPEETAVSTEIETTTAEETTTTATTITTTQTTPETEVSESDKYSETLDRISYFMGRFTSLGTGNYDDIQSCIVTEETDAMGQSTEGGGLVKYMTDEGEILRYSATFYGETGRVEKNYYIIDNSCAYYTALTMDYYCRDYRQEQFGDILKYSFEEYWLDNGEYYLIDRINSALIPYEKNPAEFFEKYLSE